eukprot:632362-Pelagomonas_calceolata.AAC.2
MEENERAGVRLWAFASTQALIKACATEERTKVLIGTIVPIIETEERPGMRGGVGSAKKLRLSNCVKLTNDPNLDRHSFGTNTLSGPPLVWDHRSIGTTTRPGAPCIQDSSNMQLKPLVMGVTCYLTNPQQQQHLPWLCLIWA